jgi:three-Cys-motif partner protein
MTNEAGRSWGFWTQAKLGVLEDYLDAFVVAASGASERVYLDAFAGEGTGLDRLTGEAFKGSARIALETNPPGFTRFRFFEKGQRASELEARLRSDYPDRDIAVYAGDCNEAIPRALEELEPLRWAPTFAFIDPDGMELSWSTLRALAAHKGGYRGGKSGKPEYKVELWMLFPSAGLMRTLALDEEKLKPTDEARATRLFGEESWRPIYARRLKGRLSGSDVREEYVNLMRWRIQRDLDYRWTHPLELKNTRGIPLYHMIFATDNEAGTRIMEHLYASAAAEIPAMQKEAADRAIGQQVLDLGLEPPPRAGYRYEPPWEPPDS